jgi:hypothetical protein
MVLILIIIGIEAEVVVVSSFGELETVNCKGKIVLFNKKWAGYFIL